MKSTSDQKEDKFDFSIIKNFCIPKDAVKKMKTQHNEWQKTFANNIYDKELVARIDK